MSTRGIEAQIEHWYKSYSRGGTVPVCSLEGVLCGCVACFIFVPRLGAVHGIVNLLPLPYAGAVAAFATITIGLGCYLSTMAAP